MKLNSGETYRDFYNNCQFNLIPSNALIVSDGKLHAKEQTTRLFITPVRFPKAFYSVNASRIWKKKSNTNELFFIVDFGYNLAVL